MALLFSRLHWFPVHIPWRLPFQSAPIDFQMAVSISLRLMAFSGTAGQLCFYMWQTGSAKELTSLRAAINQWLLAGEVQVPQLPFPLMWDKFDTCILHHFPELPHGINFQLSIVGGWLDNALLSGYLPFSVSLFHSPIHVPKTSQIKYLHWILGGTQTKIPSKSYIRSLKKLPLIH